jgi:predicted nucleotide-binding protein (sugar kinase/HSP70/actin superfamily)
MPKVKKLSKKKLTKVLPLLELLSRLPPKQRETAASYLNDEGCEAICECVHNSITNLSTNLATRTKFKQKTKASANILRFLANDKKSPAARRKKISQLGGSIIGLILSVAIPLLAGFLTRKK